MTVRTPAALKAQMPLITTAGTRVQHIHDFVETMAARTPYSPEEYGAVGDGVANDAAALQAAINAAYADGRSVRLSGKYKVLSSITLPGASTATASGVGVTLYGDGENSQIHHAFDGRLFTCSASLPAFMAFRSFKIVSTSAKSATSHAFYFAGGLTRSVFCDIRLGRDGTSANAPAGLFDCLPSSTTDTILFRDCYLEEIETKAYGIGSGSSIWFEGGRVIGIGRAGPTGIHLYGGNGGVWLDGIDLIQLENGMKVTKDNTVTNREIFIVQAAFDSCNVGLWLLDESYCEVQGIWAASCNEANILLDTTYAGIFLGSGGTVFNAGSFGGSGSKTGMAVNGGQLVKLDGVAFRNNIGAALSCPATGQPQHCSVTGCTFFSNGVGISANGVMDIADNEFFSNTTNLIENSGNLRISNNRGINPAGAMTSPSVPASTVAYTYTGNYPVNVFIANGTVTQVAVNGTPVLGSSNVVVPLDKGETIALTYSVAPTWVWLRQ